MQNLPLVVLRPLLIVLAFVLVAQAAAHDPLPSWNAGPLKQSIMSFVASAVDRKDVGYIEPLDLMMATHTGMTTDAFAAAATNWLASARHPACDCPYTDRVYAPMLELLAYLRANGFKTYIVSGGTAEFMRAFAEQVYGIPPEQVIGSTFATQFRLGNDGKPEPVREPKIDFVDDGPGKPVGINKFIGRRPVFAFGNSDGDQQMLEWVAAGSGPRFAGLVHHTDAQREYAYDRTSKIGRLDKALDEAKAKGWTIVDMNRDWATVFPRMGLGRASRGDQP
jgi:hypothetical protein